MLPPYTRACAISPSASQPSQITEAAVTSKAKSSLKSAAGGIAVERRVVRVRLHVSLLSGQSVRS